MRINTENARQREFVHPDRFAELANFKRHTVIMQYIYIHIFSDVGSKQYENAKIAPHHSPTTLHSSFSTIQLHGVHSRGNAQEILLHATRMLWFGHNPNSQSQKLLCSTVTCKIFLPSSLLSDYYYTLAHTRRRFFE